MLDYMPSAMRDLGFDPAHPARFLLDRCPQAYCFHPKGALSIGVQATEKASGCVGVLFSHQPMQCGGKR